MLRFYMKGQPHNKPTGDIGQIRITNSAGSPLVTWEKIRLPNDKAAQETLIATAFVKQLNADQNSNWGLKQLKEDDFDFVIRDGAKSTFLELLELVIPPAKKGPPYASKEQVIRTCKYADTIISEIEKKSRKYPRTLSQPLGLLIYVTHWRFKTSATVRSILSHYLNRHSQPFSFVWYFSMHDEGSGAIDVVFPNPLLAGSFNPKISRTHSYANIDPANAVPLVREDGSIGMKTGITTDTIRKLFGSNEP